MARRRAISSPVYEQILKNLLTTSCVNFKSKKEKKMKSRKQKNLLLGLLLLSLLKAGDIS
ncbi:MAG: hypothetical protein CVV49_08405 [Spirochaetae bacterium HGW-Spirochaetae-5]|nr:MAG: hypothetical protein CVV49_08405 [Spirochaetae bacterium HGW-Spirochaetae-5]